MLDWINALLDLYGDTILFFLNLPLYGQVSIGNVLIAIVVIGTLIDFLIRRVR